MRQTPAAMTPAQTAHKVGDIVIDKKGTDLVVLDVEESSGFADYMVIATGGNRRQVQAMAEEIRKVLKECGKSPLSVTGTERGWWVLLDYGDVLVHLMQEDARRYYDLEALWADATVVRRGVGGSAA